MSNYKLFKKEGKLKEMPGEEPAQPICLLDFEKKHLWPQYEKDFAEWEEANKNLKEYIINPSDWRAYGEGAEVKEFVLQHQFLTFPDVAHNWKDCNEVDYNFTHPGYRRIIAKPSAKAKPDNSNQPEEKRKAANRLNPYTIPQFSSGWKEGFYSGANWAESYATQLKEEGQKLAEENLKAYDKLWNENEDRKEENKKLREALEQSVYVIKAWHNMDNTGWKTYYEKSPEMKPIREALSNNQIKET